MVTDAHRRELHQSGISDQIIDRNFASLTDSRDIDQFLERNTDRRWKHGQFTSGWKVAGVEPQTGEYRGIGGQFKPDQPRTNQDGKVVKYESISGLEAVPLFLDTGDRHYWQSVINSPLTPIVITEGAKKAGCVLSQEVACISISGVTNGQKLGELRDDIRLFCQLGRTVYLAFDMDLHTKPQVAKALDKLARLLCAEGCVVKVLMWSEEVKGIDDYLVSTGDTVQSLMDKAWTIEKWRSQFVAPTHPESPVTEKPEKRSMADELIYLVLEHTGVTLWHTDDQDAYADILEGTVRQTLPIRHISFRRWLRRQYFVRHRKSPNDVAMVQAIATIESFAVYDSGTNKVHLRTAEHEGRIYYDLGDETWQAVEVSRDGWRIVSDAPIRFRRIKSMLPLPVPTTGGSLSQLREFMNLSDEHWVMVITFLINCLNPCENYPILIVHGEADSGKTTLCKLLKRLVDPSEALLMPTISDLRNLSISAFNRHVLVYDNLSGANNEQSDALCRIATGASFSHRKLQTDTEETTLDFVRPQIINGIDSVATRGDLLSRSMLIQLTKPKQKADLKQYWANFERLHPQLLGALFTALGKALALLPTVEIENLPRMAEFAKLGTALEKELGLADGGFMSIHTGVKQESHHTAIDASPIAQAIIRLMENRLIWKGYVKELLAELNRLETNETIKKGKAWATDSTRLSKALTRIAPDLRALGIDIINNPENRDRHGVILFIEKQLKIATSATSATQPIQSKGLGDVASDVATKNLATQGQPDKGSDVADVASDVADVANENLATPLEPSPSMDGVADVADVAKNGSSSSKGSHDQPSLFPNPERSPTPYELEDGDKGWF